MKEETSHIPLLQERYLLQTFPLIKKIAARKLNHFRPDAVDDLVQKVILKLWNWKLRHQRQNLSEEDWLRLANCAAHNEIKTFYSSKLRQEIPLSDATEEHSIHTGAGAEQNNGLPGNTEAELSSLLRQLWKAIQFLSLRQKYALLLGNEEFIVDLIVNGVSNIEEIADSFELSRMELNEVIKNLPFSDERIRDLLERKLGGKLTLKQVWSARDKAKINLTDTLNKLNNGEIADSPNKELRGRESKRNERTPPGGKT